MDTHSDILRAMKQIDAVRASNQDSNRKNQPGDASAPAIAGYEIVGEIHRGGQGVVYRAIQTSTKRDVAIKVIRGGPLAGTSARLRFQREVEILASLQHSGIVTVHDSGSILACSYFVMDYIEGASMDVWLAGIGVAGGRENRSAKASERVVRQVLELFVKICDAVHAAHVRGVIHRDLKPANVLVDGNNDPRVLDFGLARLETDPDEPTALTSSGQFLGTLPWSSPEQARGASEKTDMRTDVYALGIMLYQALTGRLPYGSGLPWHATAQAIIESDPVLPRSHNRCIGRDLETVILRCLSKDPDRRYQSANELARELQRYLAGEPIEARRDSAIYVIRKQLAKHRAWVAAAAAFGVVLMAGLIVSTVSWREAERERLLASRELRKASAINQFLVEVLSSGDPHATAVEARRVRDVLDDAVSTLDQGAFRDQVQIEAAVRETLAMCFESLGWFEKAEAQVKIALRIHAEADNEADLAGNRFRMGRIQLSLGNPAAAISFLDDAASYYENQETVGYTKVAAHLGDAFYTLGRMDDARRAFESALALMGDEGDLQDRARCTAGLALIARREGDREKAATLARQAHMLISRTHDNAMLEPLFDLNELLPDFRERRAALHDAVRMQKQHLGADHLEVALSHTIIASLSAALGEYDDALIHLDEAERILHSLFGERSLPLSSLLTKKARILCDSGRCEEADELHLAAISMARELNLRMDLAAGLTNRSLTLRALGALAEAEACLREALGLYERLRESGLELSEKRASVCRSRLGLIMLEQGRFGEAEVELRKAQEGIEPGDFAFAIIHNRLARVYLAQNRLDDAQNRCQDSLRVSASGETHSSDVLEPSGAVSPDFVRNTRRETLTILIELLETRDAAEPGAGHDRQAARWREALVAMDRD